MNLEYKVESEYSDDRGKFVVLMCINQDSPFLHVSIYNANNETEQVSVIESIRSTIDTLDPDHSYNVVLGGDFNFIRVTVLDSDGGKSSLKTSSIAASVQVQNARDLVDIWRPFLQRRLDYFLISSCLQDHVKHINIFPAVCTDHSAIILSFVAIAPAKRGPSYWKFNNSLLKDNNFIDQIKERIESILSNNTFAEEPRVN